MNVKIIIRWLAIAAFGCYGVFALIDSGSHLLARGDVHWGEFLLLLGYSGLLIAVAYLIFGRQYRTLCTMVSGLAAFVVFGFLSFLISLIKRAGFYEWLDSWGVDSPWALVALPLILAALFIPFYGAFLAFRHGQAFLARFIHDDTQPQRAA